MTDENDEARGDPRRPRDSGGRPRPLDYQHALPFARAERFGWKDVAVIVFILLGPILLWALKQVVGSR